MKLSELCDLLYESLKVDSLDADVVFETNNGTHIDQFDVKAVYNPETKVLIFKEAK